MSAWTDINAEFFIDPPELRTRLVSRIQRDIEERNPLTPRGSEGALQVLDIEDKNKVWVVGSLRDLTDEDDAAVILAWFTHTCLRVSDAYLATCVVTFGSEGPRYRWQYQSRSVSRMKGVLDV